MAVSFNGLIFASLSSFTDEIGGVIMGSLDAAKAGRALTRAEYISTKRSYIETDTDAAKQKRHDIYDVYEGYKRWKLSCDKFDTNDIVLELINKFKDSYKNHGNGSKQTGGWIELFSSCYLDEIQDFSYASIYLILSIAGYSKYHWIFAGDTAQVSFF